ncbi:MAG TPA: hypothetical protein VHY33_08820 [Thermoanaerobaculia bacterium]|jgi:hypothetical protein|nr:hypothetical protein [Thermoanaerobaculia bacterium]
MTTPAESFLGRWRISTVEGWEKSDVDLAGPAHIEFARRNDGDFQFSAVTGQIDYRVSLEPDGPFIEWAWVGDDDGTEVSGRGWAHRVGEKLKGTIFVFGGDDFKFEASPLKPRRVSRGG